MNNIYRFISFESFVDLIQKRELAFINPTLWDDPYEGFIFAAMETETGKKRILNFLSKNFPKNQIPTLAILETFYPNLFAQSWTKKDESDALWRIYSHGSKALRIETSLSKIEELKKVRAKDVIYVDKLDLHSELKGLFSNNGNTMELDKAITVKRSSFSHEKEVRLIHDIEQLILPPRNPKMEKLMPLALKALLEKGEISRDEYKNGIKNLSPVHSDGIKHVPFGHIENFIQSVMVHPLAPDWYAETVKDFCTKNKIKFLGKSKLYKLSI